MELAAALRAQAGACARLGSPMYRDLLLAAAADIDAEGPGSPVGQVMAGHEDAPGPSAVGLRLLGSVHRLVLERRAGVLATYYPSVGGRWEPGGGWNAFRDLLEREPDAVREWLDRPPQTNEPGRGAALHGGLQRVPRPARRPVRLLEIGASGGLNLLADRMAYDGGDGPPAAPWPDVRFVEAVGCDLRPVDVATSEGRLALTAYVWADQPARHERLRAALDLAARHPPVVRREAAGDAVDRLELAPGRLTVLWHSVMWQYVPRDEQARISAAIDALAAQATGELPFAHLRLEPPRRGSVVREDHEIRLDLWAGDVQVHGRIGTAPAHGIPCRWDD